MAKMCSFPQIMPKNVLAQLIKAYAQVQFSNDNKYVFLVELQRISSRNVLTNQMARQTARNQLRAFPAELFKQLSNLIFKSFASCFEKYSSKTRMFMINFKILCAEPKRELSQ